MKLYTNEAVDKIVSKYNDKGGNVEVIKEGCLASFGLAICYGDKLKFCVISEQYLNEWSSGNKIRFYRELPSKYQTLLSKHLETI